MLTILILLGTLASCCIAEQDQQRQQEAVHRLLGKNSAHEADLDVFQLLHNQIGRNYQHGPLANITGHLIDMNEVSETSCDAESYGEHADFLDVFKDTPLGRYVQDKHKQLLDSCPAFYQQKFTSIASELEGDDKLNELVSFVDKLEPRIRYMAHLDSAPFRDLIETLRGPEGELQPDSDNEHQVRAVLDGCQLVYGRLREVAPRLRLWGKGPDERDEQTKKWLTNYGICRSLVGEHKGLGIAIHAEWSWLVRYYEPSLATFAHYLQELPEQVALRRSAMIPDELVAEQVVKFIEYRLRSSADGVHWPRKSKARLERFEELLASLIKSCKHVSDDFEPHLWMLDNAGSQLDKSNKQLYSSQVLALKVVRVCGLLPSIDFNEAIRQWNKRFSLAYSIKKSLACGSCQPTAE